MNETDKEWFRDGWDLYKSKEERFRMRVVNAIKQCLPSLEKRLKNTDLNDLQEVTAIFVRAIAVEQWGKILTVASCAVSGRQKRESKFKQFQGNWAVKGKRDKIGSSWNRMWSQGNCFRPRFNYFIHYSQICFVLYPRLWDHHQWLGFGGEKDDLSPMGYGKEM